MGEILKDAQVDALNAVFRAGSIYVGLGTGTIPTDASTLSNLTEVTDTAYARKLVAWNAPVEESGKSVIKNTSQIDFANWAANQPSAITYAFTTDAQTGTVGKLLAVFDLNPTIQPTSGQPATIPAQGLTISLD